MFDSYRDLFLNSRNQKYGENSYKMSENRRSSAAGEYLLRVE